MYSGKLWVQNLLGLGEEDSIMRGDGEVKWKG